MNKYSDKFVRLELEDQVVKVAKLTPLTTSLETFKLTKLLLPSFGAITDSLWSQDRSLVMVTAFNLLSSNATESHFNEIQELLLGSVLDSEGEPLATPAKINAYLENSDLNVYDLLIKLFEIHFWTAIERSQLFHAHKSKIISFGEVLKSMTASVEDETTQEGDSEEGEVPVDEPQT